MEIRTITETERPEALELVWGTFLAFVAPDYPPQGVESFRAFLNSRDTMDALEIAAEARKRQETREDDVTVLAVQIHREASPHRG